MTAKKLVTPPKHLGQTFDQYSNPYSALMCAITYQAVEDFGNWKSNMTELDKKTALLWILKMGEQYGYQKKSIYDIMCKKSNLSAEQKAFYDEIMESEVL